ncbi:hypothetical protein [Pelagicoccus sp. SDUM812002]|uniref:hypothetical protein n=1 Tax=Pelagicoccus sp. SDUM812002 TaxID=3041266 RepID=UPI00280D580D|nr:hypothetical protein [Pelagicoccus sp. SDUM812002]MDQ8187356.1 hypothetical protein [Pelagicoccus sp. SDUM812002]
MIAVLTGDIVGSQELSESKREQLQAFLEETAASTDLSANIEVFAGDSWQCVCHAPESAIHLAVAIRSHLFGKRGIDTRVSIGIGTYENLRPEKISLSQGEAFVLSGRGLEEMPQEQRLSIQFGGNLPLPTQELIHASVLLLDGITVNWTAKQAQAVALSGGKLNQYELAEKFDPPISAQAFGKHLAKARWKLIKQALTSISHGLHEALKETEK